MLKWTITSLALVCGAAHGAITVQDDAGKSVTLTRPALRIISMSPHVTELLFAAGGGKRIVGAMNFSDYPEEAKRLPLIGSNSVIDMERVLALRPDLLVVWQSGNTARQLEQLAALGIPIFYSEPKKLDDIASNLTRLGQLMGTEAQADQAARAFRSRLSGLRAKYAQRPPVRVFYQIWDKPLYTLSGQHIVTDAMAVCGAQNVFANLSVVAPQVSTEAVLEQNPEVIVGGEPHDAEDKGIQPWRAYKSLLAVKRGNLFSLTGERLTRSTPRMAEGIAELCERIEQARSRRK